MKNSDPFGNSNGLLGLQGAQNVRQPEPKIPTPKDLRDRVLANAEAEICTALRLFRKAVVDALNEGKPSVQVAFGNLTFEKVADVTNRLQAEMRQAGWELHVSPERFGVKIVWKEAP